MTDRKIPAELQEMVDRLKALGIPVEFIDMAGGESSGPVNSKEELLNLIKGLAGDKGPQPTASEAAMLSTIAHGLSHLAKHLEPQISKVDDRSLSRDKQIREAIDELSDHVGGIASTASRQIVELQAQVNQLKADFSDLNERHRKQVGLLHRRVTKRKVEVKTVKAKTAAVKGSVTRLRKTMDHSAD